MRPYVENSGTSLQDWGTLQETDKEKSSEAKEVEIQAAICTSPLTLTGYISKTIQIIHE